MAEPPFIFLTAAALLRYNIENISPEKGASFVAFVRKKSVLPIYLVGAAWLVWSLAAPLYRPTHYVMAALSSAAVYYLGKLLLPDRGYEVPDAPQQEASAPREQPKTEAQIDPEIAALLQERDRAVSEMRRLNDAIEDPQLSQQIDRLEHTTQKIMDAVVKKPEKLPQIRRFLNYYLPTTLKLLNAYDRMDAAGVEGANIDGTKGRIEDIMSTICTAFDRQLDALYGQEAMDISTDIDVLEQMLAREGLGSMNLSADEQTHDK